MHPDLNSLRHHHFGHPLQIQGVPVPTQPQWNSQCKLKGPSVWMQRMLCSGSKSSEAEDQD